MHALVKSKQRGIHFENNKIRHRDTASYTDFNCGDVTGCRVGEK